MNTLTTPEIWIMAAFIVMSIGGGLYFLTTMAKRQDISEDRKKQVILMFSLAQFMAFVVLILLFVMNDIRF